MCEQMCLDEQRSRSRKTGKIEVDTFSNCVVEERDDVAHAQCLEMTYYM